MRINKMNTCCFALIFYQILSTHSLRKYIEISLENLYVDIMGLKGLNLFFCEGKSEIMFICLFCFGLLNLHRNLIFSTVWPNNLSLDKNCNWHTKVTFCLKVPAYLYVQKTNNQTKVNFSFCKAFKSKCHLELLFCFVLYNVNA